MFAQQLTFHYGNVNANGIVHMDTGKNIGTGICTVQGGYNGRTDIFIRIHQRPEIRSIAEEGADNQTYRHSGEKERT